MTTSQEPESLEPTKRDVVDMRDAEKTRFPLRRAAHQQASARTAESQEHTVLFVGAEICSVLIMQADEWASLAFALIWSPTRQAQSQASDPGNRISASLPSIVLEALQVPAIPGAEVRHQLDFRTSDSQPGGLTTWEEERPSGLPTTMEPGCPGAGSNGRHSVSKMQVMF